MKVPLPRLTARRVLAAATALALLAAGFEAGRRWERRAGAEAKRAAASRRDELLGLIRAELEAERAAGVAPSGEADPTDPD